MRADDDLMQQADALMRRHRSFIARPPSPPPAATQAAQEETLPVLTEIVAAASVPPHPAAMLAPLQGEIEQALSSWLAAALPAALSDLSPQLCNALQTAAQQTLLPQLFETLKNGISRQKL